jgi:PEP-CTERM motif-containing protein
MNDQNGQKNGLWKENLGRWGAYAAAAGAALAMSTSADAEVVYSGIQNLTVTGNSRKTFHIGSVKAEIQNVEHSSSFGRITSAGIGSVLTAGIVVAQFSGSGANKYARGQPILLTGGGAGGVLFGNSGSPGAPGGNPRGNFGPGTVDGFVGILLKNGDRGWVQVKVTSVDGYPTEVEAIDWAYNNSTGGAIYAGQTSDAPVAPEPNTAALGLLACGAAGLLAWRKRRAEQARSSRG